ncbi:MAG: hypothetical protein HY401_09000 [Elusimicrobia bacterium]|nr:hypothetical protein [Elusimicrobiota bacterium]
MKEPSLPLVILGFLWFPLETLEWRFGSLGSCLGFFGSNDGYQDEYFLIY